MSRVTNKVETGRADLFYMDLPYFQFPRTISLHALRPKFNDQPDIKSFANLEWNLKNHKKHSHKKSLASFFYISVI